MTLFEMAAVLLAGAAAGTINTVVGSGTLITFPTLLAFGVPPVTANVTNTVGLVPGSVTGAIGYRRELAGQRDRLLRLGSASALGGLAGGLLLLVLPEEAFDAVVPALISLGVLLVAFGPRIHAWVARRSAVEHTPRPHGRWWVWPGVFAAGVYGGYFGAAQGVLLMAVLGLGLDETLQRNNGTKNVLAGLVNAVAAVLFIAVADVDWGLALLIAVGATAGGFLGASVGRRLSPAVLRAVIVVVGVTAVVVFVAG